MGYQFAKQANLAQIQNRINKEIDKYHTMNEYMPPSTRLHPKDYKPSHLRHKRLSSASTSHVNRSSCKPPIAQGSGLASMRSLKKQKSVAKQNTKEPNSAQTITTIDKNNKVAEIAEAKVNYFDEEVAESQATK